MSQVKEALIRKMGELQQNFKAGLGERFRELAVAVGALRAGSPFDDAKASLETLHVRCHTLVGTGATLGFPDISEAASKLEVFAKELLARAQPLTPEDIAALARNLSDLEGRNRASTTELVVDVATLGITRGPVDLRSGASQTVLIVDDDSALTDVLAAQLRNFGFTTVVEADHAQLSDAILRNRPAAVLMDIVFPDSRDAGIRTVQALKDEGLIDCPVIFLSVRSDLEARIAAVRAGCDGYLVKPVNLIDLLDILDRLTAADSPDKYRVLIVDDDPEIAEFYASLLGHAGVETAVVTNALEVMTPLREMRPDIILMDIMMPGCTGFELSAAIRQDRAFVQIPIVFLSGSNIEKAWLRATQAGGDEFIRKTQPPTEVLALILARLRRARDLSSVVSRLETGERRFRAVVETAKDAIVTSDADGRIIFWNAAAERMLGYRASEILGHQSTELVPERHRKKDGSGYRQLLSSRECSSDGDSTVDTEALTKDGREIDVEISVAAWHAGEEQYLTAVIRDVSLRNEVEHHLRESEERFRKVSESAKEAIVSVNDQAAITFWNNGAEKIFGYPAEEALGKPFLLLCPERYQAANTVLFKDVLDGDGAGLIGNTIEARGLRKGGAEFPMEASYSDWSLGGERFFTAIIRDVSERRRVEKALQTASRQAEEASKAKTAFLSAMSHELRTPLNAILGFSQLLADFSDTPLSDEQSQFVGHILDGGGHLLELVNEVLDLAKIEAGEVRMSWEAISMPDMVDHCLPMIKTVAEKRSLEVSVRNRIERPVRADRSRLMQILLNLMSNAAKYNRDGGSVTVDMGDAEDEMLRLSIADSGIGIPDDRRESVFQPFDRLGAENSDIEGTGIGLTVTKQLVERMNGRIGYDSVADKGTTFWIELPFAGR